MKGCEGWDQKGKNGMSTDENIALDVSDLWVLQISEITKRLVFMR